MSKDKKEKNNFVKAPQRRKDRAAEVANTFEWLITAFILAFVFRAFVMEAFRIPTGSMADTLKGAHFRLRCLQCGYKYEYGFVPQSFNMPQDTIPPGKVPLPRTRCPSCGHHLFTRLKMPVENGDRILVLKCIYQFIDPKRWDVIVFKNPLDPSENYIKRLIGLPNEEVRIINGDIYINGEIARKPPDVQEELWMPVYDNDYQPVNPNQRSFNGHHWHPPFNFAQSKWEVNKDNPTEFYLNSPVDQINFLTYGNPSANDFKTTYAYNDVRSYDYMPICSDLMVRFYIRSANTQGRIGTLLSKYGADYKAWVDLNGELAIAEVSQGQEKILISKPIEPSAIDKPSLLEFANVDNQLIFKFRKEKLVYDMGRLPILDRSEGKNTPKIEIFGSGNLVLSHIAIFRDVYYTSGNQQSNRTSRATEDNPFSLSKDEFFVLGDNSPNSEDGRWWSKPHIVSKGYLPPRAGVVPRDYLVGKALFVYWPSGFEFPWPNNLKIYLLSNSSHNILMRILHGIVSLRWIPNVGQMRFIYGGSNDYH